MTFYIKIFEDICKPKIEKNMKDKSLYELSQNPDWYDKWCVKHPYNGQQVPITSRLGSTLISNPVDCSRLAESTRATLQGKSEPFSPSGETLSIISKL